MKKLLTTFAVVLSMGAAASAMTQSDTTVVRFNKIEAQTSEYTTPSGQKKSESWFIADGKKYPATKTDVKRFNTAKRFGIIPYMAEVKGKNTTKLIVL